MWTSYILDEKGKKISITVLKKKKPGNKYKDGS